MSNQIHIEVSRPLTPAEETFVAILVRLERRLAEQKKREKNKAPAV